MKKIIVSVLLTLFFCYSYAGVENADNENVAKDDNNQAYTFYQAYSHWSIAVSGGFNFMFGDMLPRKYGNKEILKNSFLGQFNAEVEYTINPMWGIALNYAYAPIAKGAIYKSEQTCNVHPDRNAQGHQLYAMINLNLLNLFRRYRGHTEWGWYAGLGAGVYTYNTSKALLYPKGQEQEPYYATLMLPVETRVEYSPIQSLSIFFKGGIDMYLDDKVNLYQTGALTDWNVYGGLGLRWNIGATKKPTVRTVDMGTYECIGGTPSASNAYAKTSSVSQANPASEEQYVNMQQKIDQLELRVANLENSANNAAYASSGVSVPANLNDRILAIEKKVDKNAADIRDLKIDVNNVRELAMRSNATDENTIYFDNNSCHISKEYELVLARIAKMMILDSSLQLDVSSYCSSTGDAETNKKLGEQRIDAVRNILINRYKIDANRIHAHYNGQVDDVFETMNRRCDLTFK